MLSVLCLYGHILKEEKGNEDLYKNLTCYNISDLF